MLADHRVEPQRKLFHEVPRTRHLTCTFYLVISRIRSGERHVFANRAREQEVVLRHIGERARRHLRCGAGGNGGRSARSRGAGTRRARKERGGCGSRGVFGELVHEAVRIVGT